MNTDTLYETRDKAEKALVGCLLQAPEATVDAAVGAGIMSHEAFSNGIAQAIWRTVLELCAEGVPIEPATVYTEVLRRGYYQGPHPQFALFQSECVEWAPSTEAAGHCARLVAEYAARDKIAAESLRLRGNLEKKSPGEVAHEGATRLVEIAESLSTVNKASKDSKAALAEAVHAIENWATRGDAKCRTGIEKLDKLLHLDRRKLLTVAARPGNGKSTLLGQLAVESARAGASILFVTLEMSVASIAQRCLSYMSRVPLNVLRHSMAGEQVDRYNEAKAEFGGLKLQFIERGGMTALELETAASRLVKSDQVDLLVVDYLQLVLPGKECDNREQEVSHVSATLRRIVGDHNIIVAAASQLNRASDKAGSVPKLSNLRESGAIENDSDIVLFIHVDDPEDTSKPVKLVVAKNRDGMVKTVDAEYARDTFRFSE